MLLLACMYTTRSHVCILRAQTCYGLCVAEIPNSKFFGLQYSFECWCSEENFDPKMENPAPAEDCTTPCSQNASEDCGGTDRMFAYKINKWKGYNSSKASLMGSRRDISVCPPPWCALSIPLRHRTHAPVLL